MFGEATITPPEDAKVCTTELMAITSWTPRGDTLIQLGGAVVQVDLRRPQALTVDVETGDCSGNDFEELLRRAKERGQEVDREGLRKRCTRITVTGCTIPPIKNAEIIVEFTAPDGTAIYQTVTTDDKGCYETFQVTADNGIWQVDAEFPGGECEEPVTAGPFFACLC